MRNTHLLTIFLAKVKSIAATAAIFTSLAMANSASAVLIDFDDLNPVYDPEFPCWCDNPLTDQYAPQGLLISGAWVNGGNSNNVMLTSNWAALEFIGTLPTFVSMYVTSEREDAIFFNSVDSSGLIESKRTSGWVGIEEESTPAVPNEYISFSSELGISRITIEGFYNMRTSATIDNLTFSYAAVPEPSSMVLIAIGLFGIMWRRFKIGSIG